MNMFAPLTPEERAAAAKPAPQPSEKTPVIPVPEDAPAMHFKHPKFGAPVKAWAYKNADGKLIGYVARFDYEQDGTPAKEYLPITYCDLGGDRHAWRSKGFPEPRPLYRLPDVIARPDAKIIVAEGEKAADAAALLFPDMVATTPPHGAKSPHKADWSAVNGRAVIIATDNDEAGQQFGDKVYELARAAGAETVLHLPPESLGKVTWQDGRKAERGGPLPQGWDIADAFDEGWTAATAVEIIKDLPVYLDEEGRETARRRAAGEPEELARWPFRMVKNGVEKRIERADKDTGTVSVEWKWFCSLLEVVAETRSIDAEDWGRLLRITDRDGRSKEWAMPMSMLAGDGTAYRERLLSLGLIMAPGRFAREALHEYISTARPGQKARCVSRIGWGNNAAFVLPKQTYGDMDHG